MKSGINEDEIKAKLKDIINVHTFYQGEIHDDDNLFNDLDYDSISFSALIVELEDAFAISITKQDVQDGMDTPTKILKLIQGKQVNV